MVAFPLNTGRMFNATYALICVILIRRHISFSLRLCQHIIDEFGCVAFEVSTK